METRFSTFTPYKHGTWSSIIFKVIHISPSIIMNKIERLWKSRNKIFLNMHSSLYLYIYISTFPPISSHTCIFFFLLKWLTVRSFWWTWFCYLWFFYQWIWPQQGYPFGIQILTSHVSNPPFLPRTFLSKTFFSSLFVFFFLSIPFTF